VRIESTIIARDPIPTWFFAMVVVRQGDRFLLVHEAKHGQGWCVPAGRVEPGETLVEAALRETLEETGVPVVLDGVLRVEHSPRPKGTARMRFVFLAHPQANVLPKSVPDEESLEAKWFSLEEVPGLPLRWPDVLQVLQHVFDGGPIFPLSLIAPEGAAWSDAAPTWSNGTLAVRMLPKAK
jgi:8-oxo-dGTP pyrophosphatase MutT (NUDIX family)